MRSIVTTTIAAVLILVFLYTSNSSIATSVRNMAGSPSSQQQSLEPHPSKLTLQLTLSLQEPQTSPPTLLVTATNLHDSTSLTLLTWDTPFDDKALLLGIFDIKNTATGQFLPKLDMKINRVTPPPRDAFLEIEPRHAVTKTIVLSEPGVKLEKGAEYEVRAKGRWKAVWHASVTDIGDDNLKKMGGGTGVMSWDFQSNVTRVNL